MPNAAKVTPVSVSIGELLYNMNPFKIPAYQRSYAWDEDEITDFISDIEELVDARSVHASPESHFFGGLVGILVQSGANSVPGSYYEVVDGQQRLATFMMALALLVESLREVSRKASGHQQETAKTKALNHAESVEADYLRYEVINDEGEKVPYFRLELSKTDRRFFEQLLNGQQPAETARASHELLSAAFRHLRERLFEPYVADGELEHEEKIAVLLAIKDALLRDSYVIHMVAEDRSTAYKLFTVLNDRGKTLSTGDLLRSFTLEALEGHSKQQSSVEAFWDEILAVSEADLNRFFLAYYPSVMGHRASKHDLFYSYRNSPDLLATGSDPDDALAYALESKVENMWVERDTFQSMYSDGTWPYAKSAVLSWDRARLRLLLNVLKHDLCLPLLLAAARELPEQAFAQLVNMLEKFAFRYKNIGGGHAGRPAKVYYKASWAIRNRSFDYDSFVQELREMMLEVAPDESFKASLITKLDYSRPAQRQNIRWLLCTLEDHLDWLEHGAQGNPRVRKSRIVDVAAIQIEHIYPQHPTPSGTDPSMGPYVDRLGNLAFWEQDENIAAGNSRFADKRIAYRAASSHLTRRLANVPEWNEAAVLKREEELATWASRVCTL